MEGVGGCPFRRVLLRLQLLCGLGLEGQLLIAVLLSELGDLVFSSRNHFLWLDGQRRAGQCYSHPPPPPA